jgi:hypothetical protein
MNGGRILCGEGSLKSTMRVAGVALTEATMETLEGFLFWTFANGVLNFFAGCSPRGIRAFFCGSNRADVSNNFINA